MILRRALAAYCLHVEEFLALAWIATSPVFAGSVFAAVVLLLLPRVLGAGGSFDAGAVAGASSVVPMIAALGLCIVAALALFGVANERMLIAPFEPLRAEEIAKDVARRLGAADAGSRLAFWMALSRLTAKYLKVAASPRDWAHAELFLVTTVVDGLSEEQAIAAAREQGRTLPSSRWLLIVFYIVLSLLPMVLGFLLAAGLLGAIGVHPEEAAPASVAFAFLLFAFGELLWLPAWAMGYAILHQRAQQALGKSVEIFTPAEGRVTASAAVSADGITHT